MSLASNDSLLGLGKMGDLKRRLLFLLGALVVFRIGSYIPVPGIDPDQLAELFRSQRGGILDMFIVVVTMDFMSQVQAYMMSHQYESLLKKASFKGGVFPTR